MSCPFYCKAKYIYGALGLAVSSALIGSILYFTAGSELTSVPTWAPSIPTFLPSYQPSFSPSNSPTFSPTDPPTHYPSFSPTATPTLVPTLSPTLVNLSSFGFSTAAPAASSEDSSFYEHAPYLVVGVAIFVFTFAGAYGIREYRRIYHSVLPDNAIQNSAMNAVPHTQLPLPSQEEDLEEDKGVAV